MRYVMVFALMSLLPANAAAKLITMGPTDSYQKLESAGAGDTVEIAPGTYKFRVMLIAKGTATNPIVIKAKDPKNRPVWDLSGKAVKDWPGSYVLGDRGRGCWQIKGSHYKISGVVFKGCQDTSSAGIRMVNAGPLTIHHCLFSGNTNGITGASEKLVVEHSEFDKNGKTTAMELTMDHNTIIGTYTYDQRMVDLRNDTAKMFVWINNNIIYHQYALTKAHTASSTNWTVVGKNNWVTTGTTADKLTGTLTGSDPGFTDALNKDYTLTASSPCKGKAAALSTAPTKEYYKDEKTIAMYRPRATAKDIGALEQGNTATPVGPIPKAPTTDGSMSDGPIPDGPDATDAGGEASTPDASTSDSGTADLDIGAAPDRSTDSAAGGDGDDDGCSCTVTSHSSARSLALLMILGVWFRARRRRRP